MQSTIFYPLDNTVALSFICVLTDVTKILFEVELPNKQAEIAPRYFYDGSLEYQHLDRVGGVLSHLRKVHMSEIAGQLGVERANELTTDERIVVRVAELGLHLTLQTNKKNQVNSYRIL